MSDEIKTNLEIDEFETSLKHYGILRKSGRYPWGSGETPYQRNKMFLQYVEDLQSKGLSEAEIAQGFGLKSEGGKKKFTSTDLRALKSIAKTQIKEQDIQFATRLRDKGVSITEIGRRMERPESSIRSLLEPIRKIRNDMLMATANFLKSRLGEDDYIDVGAGTEHLLGVSDTKKKVALSMLEEEGYKIFHVPVEQQGTGKITNVKILARPDATFPEVVKNKDKIKLPTGYSEDGGNTFREVEPPKSLDSNRIDIRYGPDGGAEKDGVIELRRGVDDISLGKANYAQVRVAVDGDYYLKGMAMYSDNLPKGVDVLFNTNKTNTGNKLDAMKKLERDADNPEFIDKDMPFGSIVRQKHYTDKNGKEQLSVLNIVGSTKHDPEGNDVSYSGEEGNWNTWAKTLSSQMLSKQTHGFAKKQLDVS